MNVVYHGRLQANQKIMHGGIGGQCFWENFGEGKRKRVYQIKGYGRRNCIEIVYLDNEKRGRKELKDILNDWEVLPEELIGLGRQKT